MTTHIMVVLTNAVPGREEEFDDWYTNTHLDDVLTKLDGFDAAQRFELASTAEQQEAPYRYLAIYEVEDDRLDDAQRSILDSRAERDEAEAAGREPMIPLSPALEEEREAWFYTSITERRTAGDDPG